VQAVWYSESTLLNAMLDSGMLRMSARGSVWIAFPGALARERWGSSRQAIQAVEA